MRYGVFVLSALSLAFCAAFPQDAALSDQLTAEEIVKRALTRSEAQYQSLADAAFESQVISTTRVLDANNNVTRTDWERRRQYPLGGVLFEEIVENNGNALSIRELKSEEKKKKKFLREVAERKAAGLHPQPEKEPGIRFNHEFVDRYRLKREGMATVREHRCWIITFEPKDGNLPVRTRMDQALNHSTGRFWIAQDDYGLARIEFALRKPFKYWGGFLAVIRNTDGRMDYQRVEPGIWVPADFDLKLDLEILMVKDIRRHITIKWSDYSRAIPMPGRSKVAGLRPGITNPLQPLTPEEASTAPKTEPLNPMGRILMSLPLRGNSSNFFMLC
jgi:hypothetical protein